jgi:hypothetical protein
MMIAISFFIFLWMIATKATEKKILKKYMLVRGDWQSADAKKTKAPLSRKL